MIYGVTLDSFGNVFEAGVTPTNNQQRWTTQMFSPTGTRRWVATDNTSGGPNSIVLDARGNSYVTGSSPCKTVKYDADGNEKWAVSKPGDCRSSAIDEAGNIIVTGKANDSLTSSLTVKYNPDGVELWTKTTAGLGWSIKNNVAVDKNGNIFAVATSISDDGWRTLYAVVKYDSAGNELWVKQLDTPSTSFAPFMTLDTAGNVVVAGTVDILDESNTAAASDIVVAKIDTNGSLIWQTIWFNTPGYLYDSVEAVAVDAAGDVIVTGYVDGESLFIGAKGAVVKFAGYTGTYQWKNTFGGGTTPSRGFSLVTDGEGNSYAAVRIMSDSKIFKFNSTGTQIWSSSAYPTALFRALALDGKGCLIAAGGAGTPYGIITVKLCQQGALVCN